MSLGFYVAWLWISKCLILLVYLCYCLNELITLLWFLVFAVLSVRLLFPVLWWRLFILACLVALDVSSLCFPPLRLASCVSPVYCFLSWPNSSSYIHLSIFLWVFTTFFQIMIPYMYICMNIYQNSYRWFIWMVAYCNVYNLNECKYVGSQL